MGRGIGRVLPRYRFLPFRLRGVEGPEPTLKVIAAVEANADSRLHDHAAIALGALGRPDVRKLHAARRKVIDLASYQERSIVEANEILGILCATVKTRIFRARKELGTLLEGVGLDRAAFRQLGAPRA